MLNVSCFSEAVGSGCRHAKRLLSSVSYQVHCTKPWVISPTSLSVCVSTNTINVNVQGVYIYICIHTYIPYHTIPYHTIPYHTIHTYMHRLTYIYISYISILIHINNVCCIILQYIEVSRKSSNSNQWGSLLWPACAVQLCSALGSIAHLFTTELLGDPAQLCTVRHFCWTNLN